MNDLEFIFYRPKLMFLDTVGMSLAGKVAHRQLCDYIWWNDGPPGKADETLREIASCPATDWGRVKRELIAKGWVETENCFLHRGAIKTLNESKEKYVESQNRTAAANRKPRLELLPPDAETGVTNYHVTHDVTPPVTPSVTLAHKHEEVQEDDYLTRKLSLGGLQRGVRDVLASGWEWDNCKIPNGFTNGSLLTVLRPFVDRVRGGDVVPCWKRAVRLAHQAWVDGLEAARKNPQGYAVSCWKEQLGKAGQSGN